MLLIFDWDGTLIDSSEKIVTCMQRAADTAGMPTLASGQVKSIIGLGLPEAIRTLYPDAESDAHEYFREHYARHYLEADQVPCQLFPGVMETLEQLKQEGHTVTIATGKARRGLERILRNMQLLDFFHASRCSDETRSKPDPLMLYQLLEQFSSSPEDALMVGDTTFDMQMARSAGVPRVAVSYGVHEVGVLQQFDLRGVIDQFPDLRDHIDQAAL